MADIRFSQKFQIRTGILWKKDYGNFFPMISVKYSILRDLQFPTGWNKSISCPPIDSLTGAWRINEDAQLITSADPNLLPHRFTTSLG